jgi:hypothetical protein
MPWNNNNEENAIKQLPEQAPGTMKEAGLSNDVLLLSIHQTCRCIAISLA